MTSEDYKAERDEARARVFELEAERRLWANGKAVLAEMRIRPGTVSDAMSDLANRLGEVDCDSLPLEVQGVLSKWLRDQIEIVVDRKGMH